MSRLKKEDYNNSMRLESYDLATFAGQLYQLNHQKILDAVTTPEYLLAKKVLACGCGDSFCAAACAKQAFLQLARVPMEGMPAIELSRHYSGQDLDDTLLFSISSRGKTSRVVEATPWVKKLGKNTTAGAIVNFPESPLVDAADELLLIQMPKFECGPYTEHAPCQRSYFSTMFTMMLLAVRMGEVRGHYCARQAEAYRQGMIDYAASFTRELVDQNDDRMWQLAQTWVNFHHYEVVACGPEYPNAWFGAAKFVEAYGDLATYENTENWPATGPYAKDPQSIGTVVILDRENEAFDLSVEVIGQMVALGRPTIVITDADAGAFPAGAEVFEIPSTPYRWAKPLMQYSPLGNLLGYISKMRGSSFYRYGDHEPFVRETMARMGGDPISNEPLLIVP